MEKLTNPGIFLDGVPDGVRTRFPGVAPVTSTIDTGTFDIDVNDIVLQDQLARGAYGVVYKGQVKGKTYAIKVLDLVDCAEEQVNILVEIALLKSYPNSTLVSYYGCSHIADARSSENKVMIAMELCERGALRECLQQQQQQQYSSFSSNGAGSGAGADTEGANWGLIVRLGMDIAQGLLFLHQHGIVHRDVKTTNILVTRDWRAKLCDFSFACHGDTASKHEYIYGTDEFMAPEIALGEDFNVAADMFSYGIVLCEMICGKEPSGTFLKRSPRDLFALNESELRQGVMSGCPESLEALTLQCCSREAESRTSAEECVMWLEDLYGSMGGDNLLVLPESGSSDSTSVPVFSPVREGTVVYPKSMDRRDDAVSPAGRTSLASGTTTNTNMGSNSITTVGTTSATATDPAAIASRIYYLELQVQELKAENKSLNRGLGSLLMLTEDMRRSGHARGINTATSTSATTGTSTGGGNGMGGMSLMHEFGKSPLVLAQGLSPRGGGGVNRIKRIGTITKTSPVPTNSSSTSTTTASVATTPGVAEGSSLVKSPFPPKAKAMEPTATTTTTSTTTSNPPTTLSAGQLEQVRSMIDRALEEERALQEAVYRVKREEDWEMYTSMLEERLMSERQRFDDIIDDNMKRFEEYLMSRSEAESAAVITSTNTTSAITSTSSSASGNRSPFVPTPLRKTSTTSSTSTSTPTNASGDNQSTNSIATSAGIMTPTTSTPATSSSNADVVVVDTPIPPREEEGTCNTSTSDTAHSTSANSTTANTSTTAITASTTAIADQQAVVIERLERRLETVMAALDRLSANQQQNQHQHSQSQEDEGEEEGYRYYGNNTSTSSGTVDQQQQGRSRRGQDHVPPLPTASGVAGVGVVGGGEGVVRVPSLPRSERASASAFGPDDSSPGRPSHHHQIQQQQQQHHRVVSFLQDQYQYSNHYYGDSSDSPTQATGQSTPNRSGAVSSPIDRTRFESIDEIQLDQIRSVHPPVKLQQHGTPPSRFASPRIYSSDDSQEGATTTGHHRANDGTSHHIGTSSNTNGTSTSTSGGGGASDDLTAALKVFLDALTRSGANTNSGGNSNTSSGNSNTSSGGNELDPQSLSLLTQSLRRALGESTTSTSNSNTSTNATSYSTNGARGGDDDSYSAHSLSTVSVALAPGDFNQQQQQPAYQHYNPYMQQQQQQYMYGGSSAGARGNSNTTTLYAHQQQQQQMQPQPPISPRVPFHPQSVLSTPMSASTTWRTVGSEGHGYSNSSSYSSSASATVTRSGGGASTSTSASARRSGKDLKQIGTRGTPRDVNADSSIARNFHRFDASAGRSGGGNSGSSATTPVSLRSALEDGMR